MRLSISAKIFLGFLVVLATFAGFEWYTLRTMRRLGDELRLVSRGYVELRLEVSELRTTQSNLLRVLTEQTPRDGGHPDGARRLPRLVKIAIDDARRSRLKQQLPQALQDVTALEALRSSDEEHALLAQIGERLRAIQTAYLENEELFDEVYGTVGDAPQPGEGRAVDPTLGERLVGREKAIKRDLTNLSAELRLRAQQAGLRLEASENRSIWANLAGAVFAILVCVTVMVIVTLPLRPLRRLAERTQEIARGDYKQRVDASSGDEIGALGREFNAMAAALEERELKLIRSERLATVGKIAAQITHEVRNPLSSIGLNAEMLEEELAGTEESEELRRLARAIVKEVDRLTEITEEYLRFARLPRPRLEREDLGEIASALISFLRPELDRRGVVVEAALEPDLSVAADEHQLRQALLNLLRNGAEAMPGGGRLEIGASRVGKEARLTVRDTGQGIAAEHLTKLFDPFFSTKEGGTGLGLALTQQIVAEHGGSIEVQSELGRGTTFVVRLPALERELVSAEPARPGASG
jgi:signal transduction histidine kinase